MKIAIDISQAVYEGTGVGRYVCKLTESILIKDKDNDFILFGYSWGQREKLSSIVHALALNNPRVRIIILPLPVRLVEFIWNRLHIVPIEWITGSIDVFWSSDWVQPPLQKADGITTIHDVSFFRFPESFDKKIISVHMRRLQLVVKACGHILADSIATKKDIMEYLHIPETKITVVYPGVTL